MTNLVLGPLLRHVTATTAAVWVETDAAATVEVLDTRARTFAVCGHHYALVEIAGLEPGTCRPYEVHVDGTRVWPDPALGLPPSHLRTRGDAAGDDERLTLWFGSCRYPPTGDPEQEAALGRDALDAHATALIERLGPDGTGEAAAALLPDAVLLLGDQVYADETTERTRAWIAARRNPEQGAGTEIADYPEYAHLYHETWSDPTLRWLLSTVPSAMIFDDHDVRDDWNTSQTWRDQMAQQSWWPQRIRAGIASYWVYQHLGNLGPDERAADPLWARVQRAEGDVHDLLAEYGARVDAEVGQPEGRRWSYRWDLGRTRLLMLDSRCGRVLTATEREMINTPTFTWLEQNATVTADDHVDHVLVGTSIPWLMAPAIHHVQTMNERSAARPGRLERLGRMGLAERLRQGADLEHWPAFRHSFDRLAHLLQRAASATHAPATVCVLSGDVHHSYAARADFGAPTRSRVYQLTCSPVRNRVPWYMEHVFTLAWRRGAAAALRRVARWWNVPPAPVSWDVLAGPYFGNALATLTVTGRDARLALARALPDGSLESTATVPLG